MMRCMLCKKDLCYGRSINFCSRKCVKRFKRNRLWRKIKSFIKSIREFLLSMLVLGSIYLFFNYLIWAIEKYVN